MNLYDIINKNAILIKAFEHPALRIKARSAYRPDIDVAMKAVYNTIEYMAMSIVGDQLRPSIQDILEMQILMDGEWKECDHKDEWESAIDDAVEKAVEPFVPHLSADWLGRNTIGCALHEEGGVDKFIKAFSKEIYKQLTYDKTPAQVMSNAGIVKSDVEAMLERHLHSTPTEKQEMQRNEELDAIIGVVAEHVGPDYDVLDINAQFDLASDDDDILAIGAGARLGLAEEDVAVLQGERLVHGEETADVLSEMLADHIKGKPKASRGKAAAPKAEKPPKPAKAPKPAAATLSASVEPSVLTTLRENGAKDGDMATLMGVSRATYNNWSNGKTECTPADPHRQALRGAIVERINALHEALASLDGVEAEMVF